MELKDLLGEAYRSDMTLEEVEEALAGVSLPADLSGEVASLRVALSNANSEASKYKKELKSRMTDQELKDKESADQLEELQAKYDALLRESELSKNKAKLVALGYDDKLADETAKAMFDGDTDKVLANQKKYAESIEKRVKAELIQQTPPPVGGTGSKTMTVEDIMKVRDPVERQNLIAENVEKFEVNL